MINGIKVFMDPAHALYLVGMQIEWVEGLNNRGFSLSIQMQRIRAAVVNPSLPDRVYLI